MDILLRGAQIVDPASPFHLQKADIFITKGIITDIHPQLSINADKIIDVPGLKITPGWVDIFSNFCDPGYEYKETIETGVQAAAAGGYTDVMLLPNTTPVVHNKSAAEYIAQKNHLLPVTLHPIGAITKNAEGKELAEMYDMHGSGAVAFSDGINSLQSSGILLKALQYIKAINKVIIQVPDDKAISPNGLMNEGIVSTQLGLAGKPSIAEEVMIARDIELAKYTESKIHFTGVSTAKGIALIKRAKEEGIMVTCSVTPYHLYYTDEDVRGYDTNLKVNPPIRSAEDREALRAAVLDGTIDCIATHHLPQDVDNKVVEFEYAKPGMIGLQTSFAVVKSSLPNLPDEKITELFCINPRRIFGLPPVIIDKGAPAVLSLFITDRSWTLEQKDILSKSKNTPFIGQQLTGKPVGIINKDNLFLSELI